MRKNSRIPIPEKIRIAKLCYEAKISKAEGARQLNVSEAAVKWWVYLYQEQGEHGFVDSEKNQSYSTEVKLNAIRDYLNGAGSYKQVAAKFGLRSESQLKRWVRMYNSGEDFSHKMSGGSRMKTSRNTTKEERIQIVKDCIANDCNYGEAAIKHSVSYQQVYSWVKRFKEFGEAGLEDRRGRRKVDQEPRSEVEELKIKMAQLEHKLYMTEMERDLLKKVKELERKDLYRK